MSLSELALISRANHTPLNQRVPGSSPGAPTKPFNDLPPIACQGAHPARSAEHDWHTVRTLRAGNLEVAGSNPAPATNHASRYVKNDLSQRQKRCHHEGCVFCS